MARFGERATPCVMSLERQLSAMIFSSQVWSGAGAAASGIEKRVAEFEQVCSSRLVYCFCRIDTANESIAMELRHLRYFVTVAEELHFGRAAQRLHLSQPPLSMQMKALEQELGAQLLERSPRRVELTPAGQVFLKEAREILARVEQAGDAARRAARGEVGELIVGFVTIADYNLLPQTLSAFRARNPGIRLVLREATSVFRPWRGPHSRIAAPPGANRCGVSQSLRDQSIDRDRTGLARARHPCGLAAIPGDGASGRKAAAGAAAHLT